LDLELRRTFFEEKDGQPVDEKFGEKQSRMEKSGETVVIRGTSNIEEGIMWEIGING
jgi:hypothetical protein